MCINSMCRLRFFVVLITSVVFAMASMELWGQSVDSELTRDTIVAWLRHQEGLVRSMICRYEIIQFPTREEMIPLIREAAKRPSASASFQEYVWTEEMVQDRHFITDFQRSGIKERVERFRPDDDPEGRRRRISAFDGILVRTLGFTSDESGAGKTAGIETARGAHWTNAARFGPFSLYEYVLGDKYSEIVAHSKEVDVVGVRKNGRRYTKVSVRHPRLRKRFVLWFDEENRLAERSVANAGTKDSFIKQRHVYSDYRSYRDESGELIQYPHRASCYFYMGETKDGQLVEHASSEINVLEVRFNVPISDDTFTFEVPEGVPFYDGVGGHGWVGLPESTDVSTGVSQVWTRWMIVLGVVLGFLAIVWRLRVRWAQCKRV